MKKQRTRYRKYINLATISALLAIVIFIFGANSIPGIVRMFNPWRDIHVQSRWVWMHYPTPDTAFVGNHGNIIGLNFEPIIKICNYGTEPLLISKFHATIYPIYRDLEIRQYPVTSVEVGSYEGIINSLDGGELESKGCPVIIPAGTETYMKIRFRLSFYQNGRLIVIGANAEKAYDEIKPLFGVPSEMLSGCHFIWRITLETNRGELEKTFEEPILFHDHRIFVPRAIGTYMESISE